MRFLLDTNVLIPLEPGGDEFGPLSASAAELHALLAQGAHQPLLHPAYRFDLARDGDLARRARTEALALKYPLLQAPPTVGPELGLELGTPAHGTNDWVDDQLLAALAADAIDYLVTEDQGVHRKAARIELGPRVATVAEAAGVLRSLFDLTVSPPPSVVGAKAYELDLHDPIFVGLRGDYPGFDHWMKGIRRGGRDCWVIQGPNSGYGALAIIKREDEVDGVRGKVLKLSTFKVAEDHRGRHYGELLLKTVFEYARLNEYDVLYVTVYPKHEALVRLLNDFGFTQRSTRPDGELVLVKRRRRAATDDPLGDLDHHVRYGPPAIRAVGRATYLVPIRPTFHQMLFPEQEVRLTGGFQLPLLARTDEPFGNALRKAYLSKANIRSLEPGNILLFYRSGDLQAVTTVGIVEAWEASSDPAQIARFVGKRTVYSYPQIERMCREGEVLALLFRQDRVLDEPIRLAQLEREGLVKGPPQSIMQAYEEALPWLAQRIGA